MAAQIIDGKAISERLREDMKAEVAAMSEKGMEPCLAVIIVGEDPASKVYVRNKERACRQLGMDSILLRLPETTSQEELIRRVDELNADKSVNGILVQNAAFAWDNRRGRSIAPHKPRKGRGRLPRGQRLGG